jgi:hypothetical protein
VIGPIDDLIAAAIGTSPDKVRAAIITLAVLLCILVIGIKLFASL